MVLNTKHIYGVIAVTFTSIALVAILAWKSIIIANQNNGFNREYSTTSLKLESVAKREDIVNVSGATDHTYYFKTKDPSRIYAFNINLTERKEIKLKVPNNFRIASAFITQIDSPNITIMAGNGPAIISASLNSDSTHVYSFPYTPYSRAVKISPSTYIFRGFDTTTNLLRQIFLKGNPLTNTISHTFRTLGENDGGISSDGYLAFDSINNLLVYVSYFNNSILGLDTNLHVKYNVSTIDTFKSSKIQTEQVKRGRMNSITSKTPKRIINKKGFISNGILYNISNIRADNEAISNFNSVAAIDKYSILTGEYIGSFYIPPYNNERAETVKKFNDKLIVLYKTHVALYKLIQN